MENKIEEKKAVIYSQNEMGKATESAFLRGMVLMGLITIMVSFIQALIRTGVI